MKISIYFEELDPQEAAKLLAVAAGSERAIEVETSDTVTPSLETVVAEVNKEINEQDPLALSSAVAKVVTEFGLDNSDLEKITGTGKGGKILKKDVLDYVESLNVEASAADGGGEVTPEMVTTEMVTTALRDLITEKGMVAGREILSALGFAKVSDITEDKYAEVLEHVDKARA